MRLRGKEQIASHEHAAQMLEGFGKTVLKIIRVDPDCILFLGASKAPMTAWVKNSGEKVRIITEAGFPALPPHGFFDDTQEAA